RVPAVADQPERAVETGHSGDSDVVGAGRASALRPYHDAALRPGQSPTARDDQGGERGRSASGTEQDRGGSRAGLAAGAARLLHAAAVARALDSDVDTTVKPLYGHQEGAVV